MPTLPRLAGRMPPPIQLITEAATRSAGRLLAAFGTIVGWSSATRV